MRFIWPQGRTVEGPSVGGGKRTLDIGSGEGGGWAWPCSPVFSDEEREVGQDCCMLMLGWVVAWSMFRDEIYLPELVRALYLLSGSVRVKLHLPGFVRARHTCPNLLLLGLYSLSELVRDKIPARIG